MKWTCIWNVTLLFLLLFWNEEYVKWEQMFAGTSEESVCECMLVVGAGLKRGPFCIEIGWNVAQREFLRVKTGTRVFTGHSRTSESQISHNFVSFFNILSIVIKRTCHFLYVNYPFPCTFLNVCTGVLTIMANQHCVFPIWELFI